MGGGDLPLLGVLLARAMLMRGSWMVLGGLEIFYQLLFKLYVVHVDRISATERLCRMLLHGLQVFRKVRHAAAALLVGPELRLCRCLLLGFGERLRGLLGRVCH